MLILAFNKKGPFFIAFEDRMDEWTHVGEKKKIFPGEGRGND